MPKNMTRKNKMILWSQDNYIKAWNYASAIHAGQKVPGTKFPYINHLGLVAMEVMTALAQSGDVDAPDLAVTCALLHDAIEDTDATYDDIEARFGPEVAQGVLALTKDETLPSKAAQMQDSLRRIKEQPHTVWMVKLADRITNLQPPPSFWTEAKILAYRDDARLILSELSEASAFLADRLGQKIEKYVPA